MLVWYHNPVLCQEIESRVPQTRVPVDIGFSQRLFDLRDDLLRAVEELVRRCPCERGCPACVGPVSEEADEAVDAKGLTLALVEACLKSGGKPG